MAGFYDATVSMEGNAKTFLAKQELVDLIAETMKKLKRKTQQKARPPAAHRPAPRALAGSPGNCGL